MEPILMGALVASLVLGGSGALFMQQRRSRARQLYEHHLQDALADGILTEEEAEELASLRKGTALADAEVRMVALSIYRRALSEAASDSRITVEEDTTLRQLQEQLSLSDRDLEADRQQVQRVRLLARIERGILPEISPPMNLDSGEVCHWAVQARMAQRLSIPGASRTEAAYLSFRIEGGTPFHASGPRTALAPREDVLPQDLGMLMVTSRRALFRGARKLTAVPHIKLELVDLYEDGVRLQQTDGSAQLFLIDDPELTTAILLTAARHRRGELRGSLPERTA